MRRLHASLALAALLCALPALPCAADTLAVPGQYDSIQVAIGKAQPGDTVLVSPKEDGTPYNEAVTIDKANIRLEGQGNPVLDGTGLQTGTAPYIFGVDGISVLADGVTVCGFTVRNFTGNNPNRLGTACAGILVSNGGSSDIHDNTVLNNEVGIYVYGSNLQGVYESHQITDNTVAGNSAAGVRLFSIYKGTEIVENNTIRDNGSVGLDVSAADGARVRYNTITGNGGAPPGDPNFPQWCGIYIANGGKGQHPGSFENNNIQGNAGAGIYCVRSSRQTIGKNTLAGNGWGVWIDSSLSVTVQANTVTGSVMRLAGAGGDGIVLAGGATKCLVNNNEVKGNAGIGISVLADAIGNVLTANTASENVAEDAADATGPTAGSVLNVWGGNLFGSSSPDGLGI